MSKRRFLYIFGFLLIFSLGGWFVYEEYWEYRVKEGAKALGYELNDEEVRYWVKRIRSYNRLDGFDEDIEKFIDQDRIRRHLKMNSYLSAVLRLGCGIL